MCDFEDGKVEALTLVGSRVFLFVCAFVLLVPSLHAATPYELVDPRIGTANEGQTYPVVGVPFGMTGWSPETRATEEKCVSPYYYNDKRITGFRGSHWLSGSCTQDYGSLTIMPTVGKLNVSPESRSSAYRHESEVMAPAYYSVQLDDYHIRVELTGTSRSGMLRITFPEQADANIVLQPNSKPAEGYVQVRTDKHEVVGYNPVHRLYQGAGQPAGFSGYYVVRFQQAFANAGVWCGTDIRKGVTEQKGECVRVGAYVTFPNLSARVVLVKVGTSFTSLDEAEKNLDAEEAGWDFDQVRKAAEAEWRRGLERIEVRGGSLDQQKAFYTALFHTMLVPRVVSDADGTYNGFANEGKLHNAGTNGAYYDDFSLWDTFRALHPLLTILDPSREEQMIQSLIAKGEQGGFMPIFPTWNHYTAEMIGDHAVSVIADAYAKGLGQFDVNSAYRLIKQNATVTPPEPIYKDGKGRRALTSYLRYGYIPLEDQVLDAFHKQEQVSRTLEYAYDDFLAGQLAQELGKTEDAKEFFRRSENWRNVLDPSTGFVRGRHEDGSWIEPFQPSDRAAYITEGVPWQYTFFVPQNIPGLIEAVGGKKAFIAKLDGLFEAKLYEQGNEPSHQIAYLYNYAGAAWKTQSRIRQIMESEFHSGPGGLPGNDDAGQMSAWYVLSAMGFYQVCPGKPSYALTSPLFPYIAIHQSNGKTFTIRTRRTSASDKYIQSAELNGRRFANYELSHHDITSGSTLTLTLGPRPNPGAFRQK